MRFRVAERDTAVGEDSRGEHLGEHGEVVLRKGRSPNEIREAGCLRLIEIEIELIDVLGHAQITARLEQVRAHGDCGHT